VAGKDSRIDLTPATIRRLLRVVSFDEIVSLDFRQTPIIRASCRLASAKDGKCCAVEDSATNEHLTGLLRLCSQQRSVPAFHKDDLAMPRTPNSAAAGDRATGEAGYIALCNGPPAVMVVSSKCLRMSSDNPKHRARSRQCVRPVTNRFLRSFRARF
jgi:hypothetical protein